jgi:hypothetical protein
MTAKYPPDIARLASLATSFRAAIEKCGPNELTPDFGEFPRGSCGDTSLLLGTYLKEQGAGAFTYVNGGRGVSPDRCYHGWLEAEGVIVDITADQFPEMNEQPVIVATHSAWHEKFGDRYRTEADYRTYDEQTTSRLRNAYRLILGKLPPNEITPSG